MQRVATNDDLVAFAEYVQTVNPHSIQVFVSKTEDEFVKAVEVALLHAIIRLESGRKQYSGLKELGLSKIVADDLSAASIPATPEEHSNGHVDITVKHPAGRLHKYLGECKIWSSVPYHIKGMSQLLEDYSSGRQKRGCCIEFVRIADAAGKLKTIREYLDKHLPLEQQAPAVDHSEIRGGFITKHRHASGWTVEVLHFACNLHLPGSARTKTRQKRAKKTGLRPT